MLNLENFNYKIYVTEVVHSKDRAKIRPQVNGR